MTEATHVPDTTQGKTLCFSFGDPEPILQQSLYDYFGWGGVYPDMHGQYYRPPVDWSGLLKLMGANAYHGTILHFKKNMIRKWFLKNKVLSGSDLEQAALNYEVLGNCYLQVIRNQLGQIIKLVNLPALVMRKSIKPNTYVRLLADHEHVPGTADYIEFMPGEVIHLKEHDLRQSIYGLPEYLGGIQSVLLSEESTLFRRKYYLNGAHMGYILVMNDADIDDETSKLLEKQIKESKGPGNFRSMFLNIGKTNAREPVKVIPVGDIGTKDEFEVIKNITEREMLAMHRMPPGLSGIIPVNNSGFGDIQKLMQVYHELEITSMQMPFLELNDILGMEVVRFGEPGWLQANAGA